MKVITDTVPAFKPVTIVLETQEEVNQLFSWVNHSIICPHESPLDGLHDELEAMATEDGFDGITARLEARYKNTK